MSLLVREMKADNIFSLAEPIRLCGVSLIKGRISYNFNIINMWVKLYVNVKMSCSRQAGKYENHFLHKSARKYGKIYNSCLKYQEYKNKPVTIRNKTPGYTVLRMKKWGVMHY